MDGVLTWFKEAYRTHHGHLVASTITPENSAGVDDYLARIASTRSIEEVIRRSLGDIALALTKDEKQAWQALYMAYYRVCGAIVKQLSWDEIFSAWKEVVNALVQGYSRNAFDAWTVPCIYTACKYLRIYASKADRAGSLTTDTANNYSDDIAETLEENAHLEDAARQTNRLFSLCVSDRNSLDNSRKWALYNVANSMFKIYFRLDSMNLAKNILRSIRATMDLPSLGAFPKAHQLTFNYYEGIVHFLDEEYAEAYECFSKAYALSPRSSPSHRSAILTYLIPCRMVLQRKLPSAALLNPYPNLKRLFGPLNHATKQGDLAAFDASLVANRGELIRRRIYLTLERTRELALRNAFRRVFLAAGFEDNKDGQRVRRTRIRIEEFEAGLRLLGGEKDREALTREEVECLLAHCIYQVSILSDFDIASSWMGS